MKKSAKKIFNKKPANVKHEVVSVPKQKPIDKPATVKDLMCLLDMIILTMMLVEKIEDFQLENFYNKFLLKDRANRFLEALIPIAERDYTTVFSNGQEQTLQIMSEYEVLVALIRDFDVPSKVVITQMIQAYNYDTKTIEATCHRVLNKMNKEDKLRSK